MVLDVVHDARPVHHLAQISFSDAEKLVGTIYQKAHNLVRQGRDGVVERKIVFACNSAHKLETLVFTHFAKGLKPSFRQRKAAVRDNGIDVHIHHLAESLAMGTIAFRGVEGKAVRRRFL